MKILSEERLLEVLGDFEKKISLQIEDLDLTLSNRCSVIEFRITKHEMPDEKLEDEIFDEAVNCAEDEEPLFEPDKISDIFKAMPFEELMTTQHKPDNDKFNQPLWQEQCERLKKLNIAPLDEFEAVDSFQDKIAARVKKLELKLSAFITMAEENSHLKVPCKKQTLNEYLERLIK